MNNNMNKKAHGTFAHNSYSFTQIVGDKPVANIGGWYRQHTTWHQMRSKNYKILLDIAAKCVLIHEEWKVDIGLVLSVAPERLTQEQVSQYLDCHDKSREFLFAKV